VAREASTLGEEVLTRGTAASRVGEVSVVAAVPMGREVGSNTEEAEAAMVLVLAKAMEVAVVPKVIHQTIALGEILSKEIQVAHPV
jgi:secreted trypsin-like serine protease